MTWDEDDPERNRITRRALSKKDIDEADFKALIASSESESEGDDAPKPGKAAERDRLRALLLGGDSAEALPEGWAGGFEQKTGEDDVDMEVTFMPGLSEKKGDDEETTLETYQRKMRDKRKKRKGELKEKAQESTEPPVGESTHKQVKARPNDDFFASASEDDNEPEVPAKGKKSKSKAKAKAEPGERVVSTADELALLATSDNITEEPKHFSMKAVIKAEKTKGRKGKKGKGENRDGEPDELQEDFVLDVKDDRFKAVHEDYAFAVDPSNPQCVAYI